MRPQANDEPLWGRRPATTRARGATLSRAPGHAPAGCRMRRGRVSIRAVIDVPATRIAAGSRVPAANLALEARFEPSTPFPRRARVLAGPTARPRPVLDPWSESPTVLADLRGSAMTVFEEA